MKSPFIDREECGLEPPRYVYRRPTYPATHIIVHHGAVKGISPQELLDKDGDGAPDAEEAIWRGYQRFHMQTRGWSDIAYSFGFGRSGARYEGRGWVNQGGATGNPHDRFSVSFCAIGNFEVQKPTDKMLDAMVKQAISGIRKGHLVHPDELVWQGHKDKPYSTSCPGAWLYAELPNLISSTKAKWAEIEAKQSEPPPDVPPIVVPLSLESLDARVRALESAVYKTE